MLPALVGSLGSTGAASVIGSGISAVGGLIGNIFGASSAKKRAREQMAFQERMANTQHQRQVKDLRAAGLNPILSANRGAAAPVGAMAPTPDYGGTAQKGLMNIVNSAIAAKQLEANVKQVNASVANQAAQAQAADTQSTLNIARAATEAKQQGLISQNTAKSAVETNLNQLDYNFYKSIGGEAGSSSINQITRAAEFLFRMIKGK